MNFLAIDSFCQVLSVAVVKGDEVFYQEADAGVRHCELVISLIENQLTRACLKPAELDGVLCMGGPGSFTGLRIGYSTAKALALSLSIPFASVPTLDCIAFRDTEKFECDRLFLALIQARKNAYFYAFFKGKIRLTPDKDADTAVIKLEIQEYLNSGYNKIILSGPGAVDFMNSLPELRENLIPLYQNKGYAEELISIAKTRKIPDNNSREFLYSGPEYIRKTDAELNLM